MSKVFLLGVGAQKAGTSWLHQQLHSRPDADFGFLKEYHLHDARTVPGLGHYEPAAIHPFQANTWLKPRSLRRRRFFNKPELYYDYFAWLLNRPRFRNRTIHLTGDITPSYGALSAETLRTIQEEFNQRSISVRPVFVMRDPIERIISSQRMKLRKAGIRSAEEEIQALSQLAQQRPLRVSLRSNYGQTLTALNGSFGLEHCFIDLYERLFQKNTYQRLCHFLGVPYREPRWQERVNASATTTVIPNDVLAVLGEWQAPALAAARKALPQVDFEALWPTAARWCS